MVHYGILTTLSDAWVRRFIFYITHSAHFCSLFKPIQLIELVILIKNFSPCCLACVIANVSLSGVVGRNSPGTAADSAEAAHCNFSQQRQTPAGLSHVPSESGVDKKFIFPELGSRDTRTTVKHDSDRHFPIQHLNFDGSIQPPR